MQADAVVALRHMLDALDPEGPQAAALQVRAQLCACLLCLTPCAVCASAADWQLHSGPLAGCFCHLLTFCWVSRSFHSVLPQVHVHRAH